MRARSIVVGPPAAKGDAGLREFSAWPRASPLLSQEVLQGSFVQHRISQKPLQPRVLILQRLQPLGLRDLYRAELRFPFADGRR